MLSGRKVPTAFLSLTALIALLGGLAISRHEPHRALVHTVTVAPPISPGDMPDVGEAEAAVNEQVAIYLSALEVARVQAIHDAWVESILARWYAVGRCEQPGSGEGGVEWTVQSSTFSGGLGISNAAWVQWGGLAYAPNAGQATPWQQMMVAETIMASAGRRAWGCPVP